MKNPLKITMLGKFSIENNGNIIADDMNRSKKVWEVLAYMILNRKRMVLNAELIDQMWEGGQSKDPMNVLKVLIYRARTFLKMLEVGENVQIILHGQERYGWNPDIPCIIDIEEFEKACKMASETEKEEVKLECLMEAIRLYKGEFLEKYCSEMWIVHNRSYYAAKFFRISREAVEILFRLNRFEEVISVSQKALLYVPYDEFFCGYFLKALIQTGQLDRARNEYEKISVMLYREVGEVSESTIALYSEIIQKKNKTGTDLRSIQKNLQEGYTEGALFCEYSFFKRLYQFKLRSVLRTGEMIQIVELSILNWEEKDVLDAKVEKSSMEALKYIISISLRQDDFFTKYGDSRYLIMLSGTTKKTAGVVMQRVIANYKKEFPKSSVILGYESQTVTVED